MIVLVAQDVAPSEALNRLAEELERRGIPCTRFLGFGREITETEEQIRQVVAEAKAVVIGMSSSPELSTKEIAAGLAARKARVSYGFYVDTYASTARNWFDPLRSDASFVFVLNDREAAKACRSFAGASVVVTGNPLWEVFCFPKTTREEMRKQLGISMDDTVILCPGGKVGAINILLWGAVIDADTDEPVRIIITLHTGDKTDRVIYQPLVDFSEGNVSIVENPSSDLLPGCDLVVQTASTVGIEAAHQRIPVIDYFTLTGTERTRQVMGTDTWEPCVLGVSAEANPETLRTHINDLLSETGRSEMVANQIAVYPAPPSIGTAVNTMADRLSQYLI